MKHILKRKQAAEMAGVCTKQINLLIEEYDFPNPVKVGKSEGWIDTEIQDWIELKIVERNCDPRTLLQYFDMERIENRILLQMIKIYERNDSYLDLPESDRSRLIHLKSLSGASESRNPPGYEEYKKSSDFVGGAE